MLTLLPRRGGDRDGVDGALPLLRRRGDGGNATDGALLSLPRRKRRAPLTPSARDGDKDGVSLRAPFASAAQRQRPLCSPGKGGEMRKGKLEGKGRRRGGTKMSTATGAGAKLELLAGVAWFYESHHMIAQGSRRACNSKWGSGDI